MTIKFKKLIIHHFLSYDHAEVELQDKGFCLVKGINRNPKDSAKSNGSGKSSIFNAISYALTGETLQGLKSNLPNIYYNNGCYVQLEFDVDGHNYKLLRSKDDETYGTDLKITIDGEDKSGKGIRESSELLSQYLPDLTSELIGSVILIGQNMPMKFTANSPSGRKEVLEHLTQSDFMIQDLKNRITERTSKLNDLIREQDDTILSNESKNSVLVEQLDKYKKEWKEKYSLPADKTDYTFLIDHYTEEVTALNEELAGINSKLNENKTQEEQISPLLYNLADERQNVLNEALTQHNNRVSEISTQKTELRSRRATLANRINEVKNIKDVCPMCGQKIQGVCIPDISGEEAEVASIDEQLTNILETEKNLEEEKKYIVYNINARYDTRLTELRAEVENISSAIKTLSASYFNKNKELLDKTALLNNTIREKENYETNRNKLADTIKEFEDKIVALTETINASKDKRALLGEHLSVVNKMNTIIKRDFRGFLLKNIIDYVNKKAKEYASKIFGCDEVEFTLDGNNIDISFCGKDYENLSGGEKQRLDLIIQFAIRDFISQYLSFSCNILVLDEITDALDSESCGKVVDFIIEELNSVESVFIISHHADELELPQDSELLIEKTADGISRVVA